jgi:hypothetical protein
MYGRRHVRVYYLWSLVVGLPPTAISRRIAAGEPYWSPAEKLAAMAVEGLDGLAYMWAKTYSKKGTKIPDPVFFAWPGRKNPRAPTRVVLNQAPPETVTAVSQSLLAGKIKRVPRGS